MLKLVWRTDVHMSDKAPSSRKDDWAETVLDKLSQVRDVGIEVGASAIIDGGDFFHVKSPLRNSHRLVRRTVEHHKDYPFPVYCCPGNHDSVYGDYRFLDQQPLGVVYGAGIFKRLYDEHEAVFEEGGLKVRVVGIPYHGSSYNLERFHGIQRGDEDVLICVAHVLASLKGGTMFEGEDIIKYEDLLETAPDVYCFGHWHQDQGVETFETFFAETSSMKRTTFVNIGSLTRGSLSQDEVQRRPACAVLTCSKSGVSVEVRRLKVKPAEEVFDIEGRKRQIERQMEMDSFVSKIRDELAPKEGDETLLEVLSQIDVPNGIRERALSYLEKV